MIFGIYILFLNFLRHQTMDKVQKYNAFNTNTPSSESYRNYFKIMYDNVPIVKLSEIMGEYVSLNFLIIDL
jgi:hypothetical protein